MFVIYIFKMEIQIPLRLYFSFLLLCYTVPIYCQWSGTGSESNPYQITKPADLVALSNFVMADVDATNQVDQKNTRGKFWKLMVDIDMTGIDFTPIGGWINASTPPKAEPIFTGTFDGNNKKIKNLTINKDGNIFIGLFGYTKKSTIKNVIIENAILQGSNFIGGIVGYALDGNKVTNCSFSGNITASGGTPEICIGGIIGYMCAYGVISTSHSHGSMTTNGNNSYVGGVVGYLQDFGTMEECFSSMDITNKGSGEYSLIGGLIGCVANSTVNKSYFIGTITHLGSDVYIGGCIGSDVWATLSNLYSRASITANSTSSYVGGLVGQCVNTRSISHSYSANILLNTSGTKGLFIGRNDGLQSINNCYYANNFTGNAVGNGSLSGITGKSITDLKSDGMISTLNSTQSPIVWKKDVSNFNEGFPILSWQSTPIITYTITFNGNGGNGTMSSQTFTQGVTQNLNSNIFTRNGYTFSGWNTSSNGSGTSYADNQSITITGNMTLYAQWSTSAITPPTIIVNAVTSITQTSATLSGKITLGTEVITERGFEWKLNSNNTWTKITISETSENISYNLSGLSADSKYDVRVYVKMNAKNEYSTTISFTTLASSAIAPTITVNAATAITQTSATLSGMIIAGSEIITERGFEWKKESETLWKKTPISGTNNSISHNLTGLTVGTSYNFRIYVTAGVNVLYSQTLNFTTTNPANNPPIVTSKAATNITTTSATLNGTISNGTETITRKGFEWRLKNAATWTTQGITTNSTTFTFILKNLAENTQYEFRAFATTASGTTYGSILNFTTKGESSSSLPSVTTNPASEITKTSATLNGSITKGNAVISQQGFEWRASSSKTWTKVPIAGTNLTTLTRKITGLKENTEYEFRVFATTAGGTIYGTTLSFIAKDNITSVNNNQNLPITVYPNPATSSISISGLEEYIQQQLFIINTSGKPVLTTIITNSLIDIDVAFLPRGFYFIKIGNSSKKIQLQ